MLSSLESFSMNYYNVALGRRCVEGAFTSRDSEVLVIIIIILLLFIVCP